MSHHWSLDTFLGRKFKLIVLGQQLMRPSPPGPTSRLSEPFGEEPGRAHRQQRGRQPWAGRGQKAERQLRHSACNRKSLLPLPSSDCPATPSPWGSSPRGMGTLPLRALAAPGPLRGCCPPGLPEAPPPRPLCAPPLPHSAPCRPSSGIMPAHPAVSSSLRSLQAPLSMGFSRQECQSGLPFPPPGIFPTQGSASVSCVLLLWQADSLPLSHLTRPPPLTHTSYWFAVHCPSPAGRAGTLTALGPCMLSKRVSEQASAPAPFSSSGNRVALTSHKVSPSENGGCVPTPRAAPWEARGQGDPHHPHPQDPSFQGDHTEGCSLRQSPKAP